ncbi:hypothetical protein L682_18190 [Aquipseudomonas alcaligenes OT 69]|nr:hypothetical protein L682_18190 [Pseudomonas alcaligenes OT 69]
MRCSSQWGVKVGQAAKAPSKQSSGLKRAGQGVRPQVMREVKRRLVDAGSAIHAGSVIVPVMKLREQSSLLRKWCLIGGGTAWRRWALQARRQPMK